MIKIIFVCISSAVLLLSIIVMNFSPAINGLIDKNAWANEICEKYINNFKYSRKSHDFKYMTNEYKSQRDRCFQRKAMIGLEYIAFKFNRIFGSISIFLGFLLIKKLIKEEKYIEYIGFIGLIIGIVGFIFTFLYFIESWLVFISPAGNTVTDHEYRINSDGFAIITEKGKYKCIYFEKDNPESLYLRYADFGNNYLGYDKTPVSVYEKKNKNCSISRLDTSDPSDYYLACLEIDFKDKIKHCDRFYYHSKYFSSNTYRTIYNCWLITLFFSFLISILNLGLAFLGFTLIKQTNEYFNLFIKSIPIPTE